MTDEATPIAQDEAVGAAATRLASDLERCVSQIDPDDQVVLAPRWTAEQAAAVLRLLATKSEAAEKDAARYRWLRDAAGWTMCSANGVTRLAIRLPVDIAHDTWDGDELDAAIDAAIAAAPITAA